jgi:hypothetical protein
MGRVVPVTDARIALLERLIDHAPTFPPASLSPAEALAEDRRAQASPHAFVLGRLVWPASRLDELGDEQRTLSVLADASVPDDPRIESIEVPPGREIPARSSRAVYVEGGPVPPGLLAKVRCGGAVVPSVDELASFVRECHERDVPFKATAGLHHAVRNGAEHGFLNLLAAVVFGDEEAALAEEDAGAFALDGASFRWRDRAAGPEELAAARRERLHAIGSCSFFEPVEELAALGLLP